LAKVLKKIKVIIKPRQNSEAFCRYGKRE